jgi:hypothetical protein
MISPYPIFEVKLPHDEIFKILNINHIFNIIRVADKKKFLSDEKNYVEAYIY